MRVIVRRELPHPGAASLDAFEIRDGYRYQAFTTNTRTGQLVFLEARHRAHARVEDRIRTGKDTGLGHLPSRHQNINEVWTELALMHAPVERLEQALAEQFGQHPKARVLRSAPGLGPLLGARVLAEIGDDPARFTTPAGLRAFAGTAPVTHASGRSRLVRARHVRNKRLGDACHWWAFAMLTRSAGARAHCNARRAAGDHHNAALRNLANKLLGRLWWCLRNDEKWDDVAAWSHLLQPAQPVAA